MNNMFILYAERKILKGGGKRTGKSTYSHNRGQQNVTLPANIYVCVYI